MSFSITIIRVLVKCSLGRGHIVQHLPVHVSRVVHSCARAHHMVAHLVLRGLGVQGLGCLGRVWGLGRFRVLGFRGLGVQGLGCLGRVQGCRVLGLRGLGFQGLGVQDVQGLWFRDSRFRAQDGGRADARLSPIPDHPERVLSRVVQGLIASYEDARLNPIPGSFHGFLGGSRLQTVLWDQKTRHPYFKRSLQV